MTQPTASLDEAYEFNGNEPLLVEPPADSRLAQLHGAYPEAKAAADEANERLKAITDGIKAELTAAAPEGTERMELRSSVGGPPAMRLSYSETWRFDSRKFKVDDPLNYARYAKKSGSWTLKPVGGDQ